MYIEQFYTKSISQFAYYVESDGIAALIDPVRDVDQYLNIAKKRGAKIKYIFESHFHADFISGHLDLASKTNAPVIFGPSAKADFVFYGGKDGEVFELGSVTLKLLHTPGHTNESSCFLLLDERQIPHSVFTGDTLFIDDAGRPDLSVNDFSSREIMAGMLFDSIHSKLISLPNYVNIYPGHGAGSFCGKMIGAGTHSTMGQQKKSNYALKTKGKDEFIKQLLEGLHAPPGYFFMNAAINRKQILPFDKVIEQNNRPLLISDIFKMFRDEKFLLLDTRSTEEFANQFIPGSINIGFEGPFTTTAGVILNPDLKIIVIADQGKEKAVIANLALVGFENVAGFLYGGFSSWVDAGYETDEIMKVSADEFADNFRYNSCYVIDVRNPDEWIPGFVAGARLIALPDLENNISILDRDKPCFVYCEEGYRSMTAASLLKKKGFNTVINVSGGMNKIRKTSISIKQLTSLHG